MYTDYIEVVLKAIDYMEKHIEDRITIEKIAQTVHFSKFHFMKIFHAVTEQNIGTYLFRRRMTNAALTFSKENIDILSMAFRCGYNSQEAFTRAFKGYFKITPKNYVQNQENVSNLFCYPLTRENIIGIQENIKYEYDIVNLNQITIIGYDYLGTNKKKEISVMVNDFLKFIYQQGYCDIRNVDCMIGYQSCIENRNKEIILGDEPFYYMIGVKCDSDLVCLKNHFENLKEIIIPTNTYAKFMLTSRIELLHMEIMKAYQSLILSENVIPIGNYAFEKYEKTFLPNSCNSYTEFYIPIKKII